ncbi:hypothetical protein I79_015532 [Cricetulus griseus]|uniref:Uncharacterized protein n=1 Tax=Cricetulus griseus TaxID=10029 RepID=G3HX17_CRIGR|nr:hypothetical protein I79_015532 [Cricetulus griseus]
MSHYVQWDMSALKACHSETQSHSVKSGLERSTISDNALGWKQPCPAYCSYAQAHPSI